jgi:hypothetical protein
MVRVSHNFGVSAEYVFALFHAVYLLRNPLRGAGTSDFLTPLESLAGLHRVANPEPFELGLVGLKRIIMASSLGTIGQILCIQQSMPGIYRLQ